MEWPALLTVTGAVGLLTGFGGRYFFVLPVVDYRSKVRDPNWGASMWSLPVHGATSDASLFDQFELYLLYAFNAQSSFNLANDDIGIDIGWGGKNQLHRTLGIKPAHTPFFMISYGYVWSAMLVGGLLWLAVDMV